MIIIESDRRSIAPNINKEWVSTGIPKTNVTKNIERSKKPEKNYEYVCNLSWLKII